LDNRDPELSAAEFRALASLVHRECRVCLADEKRALLGNRLRRRVRELQLEGFADYVGLLQSRGGMAERQVLVDLATTHHTHFFREAAQFEWLRRRWLPGLRPVLQASGQMLRTWCAACASGEEAWSLAMELAEAELAGEGPAWQMDASDIAASVLDKARRAIYPLQALESLPRWRLQHWFERGTGPHAGMARIGAALRQRVHFHQLNLFGDYRPVPAGQHLILCRNVMIYFDRESQRELARRLHEWLAPGGYLLTGISESLTDLDTPLVPAGPGLYRRAA
jgi:chemotaxis protein methyltransferase CheR